MMPANDKPVPNAQPEAPTVARRRLGIAWIAAFLVVGAGASWLYIGEVTKNLEMRATPAVDNAMQPKQALQRERDKTEQLARKPAIDIALLEQPLQQERDKGKQLASALPTVATPAATEVTEKAHRLILQVNINEPAMMNLALNNATNVEQHYKSLGEKIEIEVITFGPGLHMLRDDTSPVKDRIKAIAEKTPSISFRACGNTQENMGKAESKTIPLVGQATLVKSGVVRIMELQEQGWTYVRP
jgi:uncharacterized protein